MPTLGDLSRSLGGALRLTNCLWLDTSIGDLRAAVILRSRPLTHAATFDLVVFTPSAREQDPLGPHEGDVWCLDDSESVLPRLGHGYVFAGCLGGLLFASSPSPTTLEQIVGALWELASWARRPWRPAANQEHAGEVESERRLRRRRLLTRLGIVAAAVVLAALLGRE